MGTSMRPSVLLAACCLALAAPVLAQSADFDSQGYRTARYRAPVQGEPRPARRIALPAALMLTPGRDALFVDVMPVEGGVRDKASGRWTLSQRHETIPGAAWHPETGRSPVDSVLWAAFVREARRAKKPVVVFCRVDCWMSWNAARRLSESGVANVWWFAEGTDGWHAAGRPLVRGRPVTIPETEPKRSE